MFVRDIVFYGDELCPFYLYYLEHSQNYCALLFVYAMHMFIRLAMPSVDGRWGLLVMHLIVKKYM